MGSTPACVNDGGAHSLILLGVVPQLDREVRLPDSSRVALLRWRARAGEVLTVVDPEATVYRARITAIDAEGASCVPFERLAGAVESPLRVEVFQALPERERFELVLQKLTELGVARIVPMESRHSTTLAERDAGQRKSHRWPEVILRAARQCRRAMLPELFAPLAFDDALSLAAAGELKLLLDVDDDAPWTLSESIASLRPQSVVLMVGPEGGFSAGEREAARAAGFLPVRLGPRILRTETAAIVATALVQGLLGDLA